MIMKKKEIERKKNMWTQTVIGQYTNGVDTVAIEATSHDHFTLFKNEEYEDSFYSAEDLQAFLEKEGFSAVN